MPYLSDGALCYDTVVDRREWRAVRVCVVRPVRPQGLSRRIACTTLIPAVRRIADKHADAPRALYQDLSITESIRLMRLIVAECYPSIRFLFFFNPFEKRFRSLETSNRRICIKFNVRIESFERATYRYIRCNRIK